MFFLFSAFLFFLHADIVILNTYSTDDFYRAFLKNKSTSQTADDAVPQPVVLIDQDSDRDATIVQLSFGDRLGALLDTVCILLCRGCLLFGLALHIML